MENAKTIMRRTTAVAAGALLIAGMTGAPRASAAPASKAKPAAAASATPKLDCSDFSWQKDGAIADKALSLYVDGAMLAPVHPSAKYGAYYWASEDRFSGSDHPDTLTDLVDYYNSSNPRGKMIILAVLGATSGSVHDAVRFDLCASADQVVGALPGPDGLSTDSLKEAQVQTTPDKLAAIVDQIKQDKKESIANNASAVFAWCNGVGVDKGIDQMLADPQSGGTALKAFLTNFRNAAAIKRSASSQQMASSAPSP